MTQTEAPRLSKFQTAALCDTALADVPIYVLPRPHQKDSAKQRRLLDKRFEEMQALIELGLFTDASGEFHEHITDQIKRTGRRFNVFGLSELGFLMFRDGVPDTVN